MYRLWLLIFLAFLAGPGFAHRRSTEAEKPQQEKSKPRLELPDVIVYGEDTEIREAGEKLKISLDSLYLEKMSLWSQYQSSVKISEAHLPTPTFKGKTGTSSTLLSALYGNFRSLDLQLKRRREWKAFSYKIDFSYVQSSGQYKNSQYDVGDAQAGISFMPSSNFGISLTGGYFRKKYGLHGSPIKDRQRTYAKKWLGGNLIVRPTTWSTARVDFETAEVPLRNKPSGKAFTEKCLQIEADYTVSLSTLQIWTRVGLLRDFYRITDTYAKPNSILNATLGLNWRARNWLSLETGLRSEYIFIKSWGEKKITSPYGKVLLLPRNNCALYLQVSREYNYYPYQQLWETNPFLEEGIDLFPEHAKQTLTGGVEYQPVSGFLLTGGFSQLEIENYRYWYGISASGLFQRGQIPKVRLGELTFHLQLTPSRVFTADLGVNIYSEKIFPTRQDSVEAIPYRPQITLPLTLRYELGAHFEVQVNAFFMGERYADINREERLREYMLLNVLIETRLGKGVSLALEGRNLADEHYSVWWGYPEMGTTVTTGMRFKW